MSLMAINGLTAEINTPAALQGDILHGLPPHAQIPVHVVDEYPACPDVWEHGSDKASSYFVSLDAGKGMWFDFTHNHHNKHEVAVVISVQGVNPITGKPITELCLVQHKKQCPVHKVDFQQDRYCPTCKHKWPAQNYIATTTGESHLWLDGFRNENGEVRQYIISEEQARGIAKQIEEKDPEFKRVWAIGFAFYLSKEPKPVRNVSPLRSAGGSVQNWPVGAMGSSMGAGDIVRPCSDTDEEELDFSELFNQSKSGTSTTTQSPESYNTQAPESQSKGLKESEYLNGLSVGSLGFAGSKPISASSELRSAKATAPISRHAMRRVRKCSIGASSAAPARPIEKVVEKKKLEVGAGARISQDVGVDLNATDFWQAEPVGMIYVNFTNPETLKQILDAGKRQDAAEGALNGMKVGN